MEKLNVAVLFGGESSEHEVSIKSGINVMLGLDVEKYNVIPIFISKIGEWYLYDGIITNIEKINIEKISSKVVISTDKTNKGFIRMIGDRFKVIKVDVVIPVLHGKNGEDGTMQGLLEIAGLPYVGCKVLGSAISMDKEFTKLVAEKIGLEQANYLVYNILELDVKKDEMISEVEDVLGFPCFVKPACTGSSIGIMKAQNVDELEKAIVNAFEFDNKIVVEEAIVGRELEVGVLGNFCSDIDVSGVGEIFSANDFYDYEAKYKNADSKTRVVDDLPKDVLAELQDQAIRVFWAVNGYGLSRVDFFLEDQSGRIIFNEINTFPGFTSISMYAKLMEAAGMSYQVLLDNLIALAIEAYN